MHVPKGFKDFYPINVVLSLSSLKQAVFEHWRALLRAVKAIGLAQTKADPCVYHKWTNDGLMIWRSWVDNLLLCGNKKDVALGRETLKQHFDLDNWEN